MQRSLFKQLIVSILFACSLSADVPDAHEAPKVAAGRPAEAVAKAEGRRAVAERSITQKLMRSSGLRRGHALDISGLFAALTTGAKASYPISSILPSDALDGAIIRLVMPSHDAQSAPDIAGDPLDAAFLLARYQMPLALQASVWPRPVGFGEPERSQAVVTRYAGADMAAMIPRLKKIFMQEGVPQQWVWVAEVESALNTQAVSSAGAAGLFQLMPGTARRFGLRTAPVDERMAPEKSAGAAAQYLKCLYREFGCWSLALAAYNAGEGRVKEIMKKRNARTFNEIERYLPSETRSYVPKVMAIVALREDQLQGVPGAYWMP